MPQAKLVIFRGRVMSHEVVLEIEDDGVGIDAKKPKKNRCTVWGCSACENERRSSEAESPSGPNVTAVLLSKFAHL